MLKAIIFDVGGVLIQTHNRIERDKWAMKFGLTPQEFENFIFNGESGRQAQLGQKSSTAHWQWLGEHFKLDTSQLTTMRHDFFVGDRLNDPLLEYIKRLHQFKNSNYRLAILSNFGDDARHVWTDVYHFSHYFDSLIISSEVGLMKPDPRIYHLAVQSLGVQPNESLFIDDFVENIVGAKKEGLQTIHFINTATVLPQLTEMIKIMS